MRCSHQPGDYLDAYFSRVFHRGESVAEVAKNTGERSFESWLASSIHTVKDLGGEPLCVTVLIYKAGLSEIEGVPVESLIKVSRL